MFSGLSEFPRRISDLNQQVDDFITPEKVRHHHRINLVIGDSIA